MRPLVFLAFCVRFFWPPLADLEVRLWRRLQ
jgi:hypothetical protein